MIRRVRLLRKYLRPGVLGIVEHERDELNKRPLSSITGWIGLACAHGWTAATASQKGEEVLLEDQAKDKQNDRTTDTDMHSTELKSPAATGFIAAIFDVLTLTTGRPAHGFSPAVGR